MTPGTLARSLVGSLVTMHTSWGGQYHGRLVETGSGDLAVQLPSGTRYLYVQGCTLQSRERRVPA